MCGHTHTHTPHTHTHTHARMHAHTHTHTTHTHTHRPWIMDYVGKGMDWKLHAYTKISVLGKMAGGLALKGLLVTISIT